MIVIQLRFTYIYIEWTKTAEIPLKIPNIKDSYASASKSSPIHREQITWFRKKPNHRYVDVCRLKMFPKPQNSKSSKFTNLQVFAVDHIQEHTEGFSLWLGEITRLHFTASSRCMCIVCADICAHAHMEYNSEEH